MAGLLLGTAGPAVAQGFLEQFSYEGLRLAGIGVEFGVVGSDRLTREPSPALRVDYGMIAPRVRVLLGAAFYRGDFNDHEISKFRSQLAKLVHDPEGNFEIAIGRITLTDVAADVSLQYLFEHGARLTTYLGLGMGVHVRDGSGDAIDGTLVEDALDTIVAGAGLSFGAQVAVTQRVHFTADFRGGWTSELRTASARGGLMYRLPTAGRP